MSILSSTSGEFHFLDKDYNDLIFSDWKDIPEDLEFSHVIKFIPNIPPAPHTVNQHLEVAEWEARLNKLVERESNASSS